ncbi:MAG TPA: M48 family metallopeptidase [Bryobacteraceae bacterium]|nr:M48 family metallopeptidase [Bryobacteraceae bacterium]
MTRYSALRTLSLCFFLLLLAPAPIRAQPTPPPPAPSVEQKETTKEYSLPPEKLQKAIEYAQARNWLHFVSVIYGVAVLLAVLGFGLSAKFRDWAEAASRRRFVQAAIFVPILSLATDVLSLPLGIYDQHLALRFDQSVQTWPSWLWDWTKGELVSFVIAIVLVFILYAVIRRSPRRWWFYFWLASLPILFTIIFLAPYVIEPLFFQFDPLAKQHADLVNELEKVVARGGLAIPPERMFEMKASEKLKSLNAYVTGFGASKRVVVWDTTLQKLTTPETLFVFGHEMGHYVLGHIRNSLIVGALFALILLYAGYHALHWMLRRWGPKWRIHDLNDWASLPALLLFVTVISFLTEPVTNAYSRWQEHQADIYGLEVIHGLVPNSREVAAHAFQVLGEVGLDEPNPAAFIEFWIYNHPSITDRIAFTNSYDPWPTKSEKYVK